MTSPLPVGHLLRTLRKLFNVLPLRLHLQRHLPAQRTASPSLRLRLPNVLLLERLSTVTLGGIVGTVVVEVAPWRAREIAVVASLVD